MKNRIARRFCKPEKGFSLIEIVMALGMTSIVGIGLISALQIMKKSEIQAQSHKELHSATIFFKQALGRQNSIGTSCGDILKIANAGSFNATGDSAVQLILPEGVYRDGVTFPGVRNLRINKLYLSENSLISQSVTEKTFVSTLYVEPSIEQGGSNFHLKKRSIATVTAKVDLVGVITSCNTGITSSDDESNCLAIAGKVWNPNTRKCQDDVVRTLNSFNECPGGLIKDGNNCEVVANACNGGTVATAFDKAMISNCAPPPPTWQIVAKPAPLPAIVVAEGATPPPETTNAPLGATPTVAPLILPGTGNTTQHSSCQSGSVTGETQHNNCTNSATCTLPSNILTPATRLICSTVDSINYSAPNLITNPPVDNESPVANECICGKYRIDPALNQVCISCRYEDSGWFELGNKVYHYEGRSCVGGNLTAPVNYSTTTSPGGTHQNCKRKVHRGVCPGNTNCRQYYNDTDF